MALELSLSAQVDYSSDVMCEGFITPVNFLFPLVHTLSEGGSNTIKTITGVSVGCVVVVMVIIIILIIVTMVRSKKSHCHDPANNDTTLEGTELF